MTLRWKTVPEWSIPVGGQLLGHLYEYLAQLLKWWKHKDGNLLYPVHIENTFMSKTLNPGREKCNSLRGSSSKERTNGKWERKLKPLSARTYRTLLMGFGISENP